VNGFVYCRRQLRQRKKSLQAKSQNEKDGRHGHAIQD
jgi:hypothetical protein